MTFTETFEKDRKYIPHEFEDRAWDPETGMDGDELKQICLDMFKASEGMPIAQRRAEVIVYIMDYARVEVQPYEVFADQICHGDVMQKITWAHYGTVCAEPSERDRKAEEARAYTGDCDFGHTCPDWKAILELGLAGIADRARQHGLTGSAEVYEAMIRMVGRLAAEARKKVEAGNHLSLVAEDLEALQVRPPQTLHEALQLSTLIYFAQQELECCILRSMGRFDLLYAPYYEHDLAEGILTRQEAKALLQYYFLRWEARKVAANLPITLCGTLNGREVSSDFTSLVIEAYGELNVISPKFHIRYTPDMPDGILRQVLSLIRGGVSSFVFCNDEVVEDSMTRIGISQEDAEDYVMVGCYESTSAGREIACTCNGRISLIKCVEYAMNDGTDLKYGWQIGGHTGVPETYEDFLHAVRAQIESMADACMKKIVRIEEKYPAAFSAPVFTGGLTVCAQHGRDAYDQGAKYNNSSINLLGIATAADAVIAVRKMVYEEKRLTLAEFAEILKNDWQGQERLRMLCRNRCGKYGTNFGDADGVAADLVHTAASRINGAPNGRGGVFRTGGFSIDWRFDFGDHTAASADGRKAGDTLSKNSCACPGMDTQGVTAQILSAVKLPSREIPNGAVLDLMLHESAVTGEEGLTVMLSLLRTYMEKGGHCWQCNVLSADTLKDAQAHPEDYPTLQVRLCGWNVRFVDLSRKEQDELIMQAEA